MAKKKPERKKAPARRRSAAPPEIPDPGVMEAMLRQMMGGMRGAADPSTPLGRAQILLENAYAEPSPVKRVELARQALAISPDCADAYVLLAEHSASRKESAQFYEKAVAAAERELGPEIFREAAGHFWGVLETRPYMRARLGLAYALWTGGRQDEAVAHAQELLRLNPGDNQGVRYTLAGWLLNLDRDEDLARLLDQYPDEGSAAWAYTRALLAFRRHGDTPQSRKPLMDARKTNKYVPDYLLGKKPIPREPPAAYSPGQPSEAIEYAGSFLAAWKNTPGALDWLREAAIRRKKRPAAPTAQGPIPLVVERLKRLPQKADIWQADCRQLPLYMESSEGEPLRPWITLIINVSQRMILNQQIGETPPTPPQLWDTLAAAMQRPNVGKPQRPTQLQVRSGLGWQELDSALRDLGVSCSQAEELPEISAIVTDLAQNLGGGEQPPSLIDVPGVTVEQLGRVYQAAAVFYQQAPWRRLGYENAIRIECEQIAGGPWFAVLMGQSGLTMGMAIYDDLQILKRLWADDLTDEENAELSVATTITFGAANEIGLADLEAARRHGWKVARADAYPSLFRKERGMTMRPPTAAELDLMEACLRAVPDFVTRRKQEDFTPEIISVTTAQGERTLKLAWEQGN